MTPKLERQIRLHVENDAEAVELNAHEYVSTLLAALDAERAKNNHGCTCVPLHASNCRLTLQEPMFTQEDADEAGESVELLEAAARARQDKGF